MEVENSVKSNTDTKSIKNKKFFDDTKLEKENPKEDFLAKRFREKLNNKNKISKLLSCMGRNRSCESGNCYCASSFLENPDDSLTDYLTNNSVHIIKRTIINSIYKINPWDGILLKDGVTIEYGSYVEREIKNKYGEFDFARWLLILEVSSLSDSELIDLCYSMFSESGSYGTLYIDEDGFPVGEVEDDFVPISKDVEAVFEDLIHSLIEEDLESLEESIDALIGYSEDFLRRLAWGCYLMDKNMFRRIDSMVKTLCLGNKHVFK